MTPRNCVTCRHCEMVETERGLYGCRCRLNDIRVNARMRCEEWETTKNNNGYVSALQG